MIERACEHLGDRARRALPAQVLPVVRRAARRRQARCRPASSAPTHRAGARVAVRRGLAHRRRNPRHGRRAVSRVPVDHGAPPASATRGEPGACASAPGCVRRARSARASGALLALGARPPAARGPGPALRHERLRRLSQRPAAGDQRARQRRASWRPTSRPQAAGRRTTTTSLAMYSNLTTAAPNITAGTDRRLLQGRHVRGASRATSASTESPEPGVTIVRDKQFGVPHIYGDTRAALDVRDRLRHGRGPAVLHRRAAPRRPGRPGLVRRRRQRRDGRERVGRASRTPSRIWSTRSSTASTHSPLRPADLHRRHQLRRRHQRLHRPGQEPAVHRRRCCPPSTRRWASCRSRSRSRTSSRSPPWSAASSATAAAISSTTPCSTSSCASASAASTTSSPARRAGVASRPRPRQARRAAATARKRHRAPAQPRRSTGSTTPASPPSELRRPDRPRGADDRPRHAVPLPDAAQAEPRRAAHARAARPRLGPVRQPRRRRRGPAAGCGHGQPTPGESPGRQAQRRSALGSARGQRRARACSRFPRDMSNALLISAAHSASGHPLAVMGPQVSYFAPQILMEEDIHGPGIDADGAAFPGTNLYVELGHGRDYAWSATSSGQNIIDTFAVPLCNPAGGKPSTRLGRLPAPRPVRADGDADPLRELDAATWPTRPRPARSRCRRQRTAYGIVIARATHPRPAGRLHATCARPTCTSSTRRPASTCSTSPAQMRNPQDFFHAAVPDRLHVQLVLHRRQAHRLLQLGPQPGPRAAHRPAVPELVARTPGAATRRSAQMTPAEPDRAADTRRAPTRRTIDQSYLTSWNNKQAPGYNDAGHRPGVLVDLPLPAARQQHQPLPRTAAATS